MAAAVLIASGTTEDSSSEFTVAAGTPTTISLFNADGVFGNDVAATLFKKSSGGVYRVVDGGNLTGQKPMLVIDGPGEFRVTKYASTVAFGVDQD